MKKAGVVLILSVFLFLSPGLSQSKEVSQKEGDSAQATIQSLNERINDLEDRMNDYDDKLDDLRDQLDNQRNSD